MNNLTHAERILLFASSLSYLLAINIPLNSNWVIHLNPYLVYIPIITHIFRKCNRKKQKNLKFLGKNDIFGVSRLPTIDKA